MRVAMIVAVAENNVIGRNNDLPWRLAGDMKHFRAVTAGKPLIMGRKTWESLPRRPLPKRPNIIVTRDRSYEAEGAEVVSTVAEAIAKAATFVAEDPLAEAIIMGGAQIYAAAYDVSDRLYYTEVHAEIEGDIELSCIQWADWREVSRERHAAEEGDTADYSFVVFDRL